MLEIQPDLRGQAKKDMELYVWIEEDQCCYHVRENEDVIECIDKNLSLEVRLVVSRY